MEDKIMLAVLVAGYLSCKGELLLPHMSEKESPEQQLPYILKLL
jgi:hypothetical protein